MARQPQTRRARSRLWRRWPVRPARGCARAEQLLGIGFESGGINRPVADGRTAAPACIEVCTRSAGRIWIAADDWLAAVLACGEGAVLSHGAPPRFGASRARRGSTVDVTSDHGAEPVRHRHHVPPRASAERRGPDHPRRHPVTTRRPHPLRLRRSRRLARDSDRPARRRTVWGCSRSKELERVVRARAGTARAQADPADRLRGPADAEHGLAARGSTSLAFCDEHGLPAPPPTSRPSRLRGRRAVARRPPGRRARQLRVPPPSRRLRARPRPRCRPPGRRLPRHPRYPSTPGKRRTDGCRRDTQSARTCLSLGRHMTHNLRNVPGSRARDAPGTSPWG